MKRFAFVVLALGVLCVVGGCCKSDRPLWCEHSANDRAEYLTRQTRIHANVWASSGSGYQSRVRRPIFIYKDGQ